jgi:hypothetical protein
MDMMMKDNYCAVFSLKMVALDFVKVVEADGSLLMHHA